LKLSKAGQDNMISGKVVYPISGKTIKQTDEHALAKVNQNQNFNNVKQLGIDGAEYKLSKTQLRHWVALYGELEGDLEEEAVVDEVDDTWQWLD
jgi:hypothetical protein